jgi:6-phosphogluconolactonase (cycloisomerase 2 family)
MDQPQVSERLSGDSMPFLAERKGHNYRLLTWIIGVLWLVSCRVLMAQTAMDGQFVYAAQDDGTVHVYDINHSHTLTKTIRVFTNTADIRGVCASAATHRFYVMYNLNSQGYVACLELTNDQVLWNLVEHTPGVDRGAITPDGQTLYLPTWESDLNSPYALAVNALTGSNATQIPMPPQTHDFICSLDGTEVFMENKSSDNRIRTVWRANNQVTNITGAFGGTVQPFSINGNKNLVIADVVGIYGFQYADLTTGQVFGTALFTGTTWTDAGPTHPHGIGMTPDEREAWACDRGTSNHYVHVFDITSLPPTQKRLVTLSHDNPHWLTFSIDGRYCYVAGEKDTGEITDVVDTSSYSRVASLSPSEDLLEVDFSNGVVVRTGDQFGIGRVTNNPNSLARSLSFVTRSNGIVLTWPGWASNYTLWTATNLAGPVLWTAVTNSISLTNGQYSRTVTNKGPSGFYHLKPQ